MTKSSRFLGLFHSCSYLTTTLVPSSDVHIAEILFSSDINVSCRKTKRQYTDELENANMCHNVNDQLATRLRFALETS